MPAVFTVTHSLARSVHNTLGLTWAYNYKIETNIYLIGYDGQHKQESRMAYGPADEALSTVLVIFKKMFLF